MKHPGTRGPASTTCTEVSDVDTAAASVVLFAGRTCSVPESRVHCHLEAKVATGIALTEYVDAVVGADGKAWLTITKPEP